MSDSYPVEPSVPRHLREIVANYRWKGSWPTFDVWADIRCICGNSEFEAIFFGSTYTGSSGDTYMNPSRIGGRCLSCLHEHLIFDKDLHGYNGVFSGSEGEALADKPFNNTWKCPCGSTRHSLSIGIMHDNSYLDDDEFVKLSDTWFEAFDQFGFDVTCLKCQRQKNAAGYET